MADLRDAIAELRRVTPENDPWQRGDLGGGGSPVDDHIATILNAVVSGDLIPKSDAELAVAEAIRRAAEAVIAGDTVGTLQRKILAVAPADALAEVQRLREERDAFRRNLRETFDALCAMRNSINEHIPMPSLESDLLQGPENSVFCSTVAEAVVSRLAASEKAEAERDAALARVEKLREAQALVLEQAKPLLDLVEELVTATFHLLDSSETSGPKDDPIITVWQPDFNRVSGLLDRCEGLPSGSTEHMTAGELLVANLLCVLAARAALDEDARHG